MFRKFAAAAGLAAALLAAPAFADEFTMELGALDQLMVHKDKLPLSGDQIVEIEALRDEAEALHKAGKTVEAEEKLEEAFLILDEVDM